MRSVTRFLSGAVLGALVGAAVAILFAPSSGEDLRGEMRSRVEHIQIEVEQAAAQRRAELEQQLAQLRTPSKPTA